MTYWWSASYSLENIIVWNYKYMRRYIWFQFFSVWCRELISTEDGAMIDPLSILWMIHEWIWNITRVMIDRAKYTTPMKTFSCHSYTTNPTCRLISWEGRWTSTVRGWRIIAWEALGIIRFLWSSPHHKKTVFPLLDETWPWSWRYYLKLGYCCDLFWPLVCACLKAKQLKCHLTELWSFIS